MSIFTRKVVAEYVSKHLQNLSVLSCVPANTSSDFFIITHSGGFHCDEALACSLLKHTHLSGVADVAGVNIIRTRDPKLITKGGANSDFDNSKCIMVDVGAEYDPSRCLYDHHQSSFHGTMTTFDGRKDEKQYATRLSSAGLIYKHYGREAIQDFARFLLSAADSARRQEVLRLSGWPADKIELDTEELEVIFDKMYKNFIEEVDAVDNGVDAYSLEKRAKTEVDKDSSDSSSSVALKQNYLVTTTLGARVSQFHHWWNEEGEISNINDAENAAFIDAMHLTSAEFFERLSYYLLSWLPARQVVERAFHSSLVSGSEEGLVFAPPQLKKGDIVVFRSFCPWKDHLFAIEEEYNTAQAKEEDKIKILFVLFEDSNRKGSWRVQAVPESIGSFKNRRDLLFKGLRDEALSEASGIAGGIFVHVSGFIGGMNSYAGAMELAKRSVIGK